MPQSFPPSQGSAMTSGFAFTNSIQATKSLLPVDLLLKALSAELICWRTPLFDIHLANPKTMHIPHHMSTVIRGKRQASNYGSSQNKDLDVSLLLPRNEYILGPCTIFQLRCVIKQMVVSSHANKPPWPLLPNNTNLCD
jgi:hypothetical protein